MPKSLANVKEDILMVTRKLLSEQGYEKVNIRTIAKKCGIATGTLYNYYRSKQEIVGEILGIEWNMMLRRMEQASKTDMELIDKLEVVYVNLCDMMNNVHNVWFENSGLNINDEELARIKCHKKELSESLLEKIYSIIKNEDEDEGQGKDKDKDKDKDEDKDKDKDKDYGLLADVICRLLLSYTYESNMEFKKLAPVIESLLR